MMLRPPPPPAPRGSRPGCRPAGEGGIWQRAPCRLGGVAITSTPSTCLLPGLGWEVGEDSRSWAPGQLSPCSCLWEEATGRSASMGTSCREPLEGVGSCLSQGARGSPREAQGWHERQEGRGSRVAPPRHGGPGPGQEPRAGLHSGAGGGLLRDTRSSCPHAGERGQEHGRGRPWAQTSRPE